MATKKTKTDEAGAGVQFVEVQVVDGSVHYGGEEYLPGDQLQCDSETAEWLKKIGKVSEVAPIEPDLPNDDDLNLGNQNPPDGNGDPDQAGNIADGADSQDNGPGVGVEAAADSQSNGAGA